MTPQRIPALTPKNNQGHHFVCYADCCSGIAGTDREATFAAVNAVVSALDPAPQFICFPGDEIRGLTADEAELYRQWDHWFNQEMTWLDREAMPLYHTTGNHTAYDSVSARVYREVMAHLPQNGPVGQTSLSYFVRRDDLLLVFVDTMGTGIGGEGRVETDWLAETLAAHRDASYKFVLGHHPAFAINGYSGAYQRQIDPDIAPIFWRILVENGVIAYLCSHMLAFDVQVHQGVLQILTAGAGTPYLTPAETEYFHSVQMAVDDDGLRYQVLDTTGTAREWLQWPPRLSVETVWKPLQLSVQAAAFQGAPQTDAPASDLVMWQFSGTIAETTTPDQRSLLAGWNNQTDLMTFWLGIAGANNQLCLQVWHAPGRSPHMWVGPNLPVGQPFNVQMMVHTGMGAGGFLYRWGDNEAWSSMIGASAWGAERMAWPKYWAVGHSQYGVDDRPFQGQNLQAVYHHFQESVIPNK
ncbi:MAG: metallophosphoesterase [Chloroflexota bacterium]